MLGKKLGHYEILEPLGAGGMGEVYRARDTRLERQVAIKVLPDDFAADPDRLARFEREAKLLASLQHANIAAIYGLEHDGDRRFIAMELVEGETLAARLARDGRLEVEEALGIAAQIAEALEAAHDSGVIHRDLKPANVVVSAAGTAKVLDFGLAKAYEADGSASAISPDSSHSPTMVAATRTGVILGTAAYMSPEQAKGKPVDKRTDIWAFGAVLYEMLAGQQPFDRDGVQETLAAVLRDEPDWDALPAAAPAAVRRLLRRCLRKDTGRRLRDIGDARIELEDRGAGADGVVDATPAAPPAHGSGAAYRRGLGQGLAASAAVVVVGLLGWLATRPVLSSAPVQRLQIQPPPGVALLNSNAGTMALSRDGARVAFVGRGTDGQARLYLRSIDDIEAVAVQGTEGAIAPFFSPDGTWLGFAADGVLQKVPIDGGRPLAICDIPEAQGQPRGVSWGDDGTILFAADASLYRVAADGAEEPVRITVPDAEQGELRHRWPQILPGGDTALFLINTGLDEARHRFGLLSLEDYTWESLMTGGTNPRYLETGHLVYSRLGTLYAVPFDPERRELGDDPVPVVHDVSYSVGAGWAGFEVSGSGSLVYVAGGPYPGLRQGELVWVDRDGAEDRLENTRRSFSVRTRPGLSPDESRIAATILSTPYDSDVQIYDVERRNWTPLSPAGGVDGALAWSPDGEWIVFEGEEPPVPKIVRIRADGTGEPQQLTFGAEFDWAGTFSSDGRVLAFSRTGLGAWDLMTTTIDDPVARPFQATSAREVWPAFSPNDRTIAYEASVDGVSAIYVAPYPGPGASLKVSQDGARSPMWNPDGSELFYVAERAMWSVPVETDPEFRLGSARLLFRGGYLTGDWGRRFTVSADGRRFLMVQLLPGEEPPRRIVHVSNWFEDLRRLVPTGR